LKRGRAEVDEGGEVGEGQVGEGEVREVNADLCGRPTGAVFKSYVPEGMRQQKPEKKKQKKKQKPAEQQLRRRLHRTAKMPKKQPCKGGHTDRDISGPKLKKAVIAELRLLGPRSIPEKDKKEDPAGRVLHFPPDVVIQGSTRDADQCYLPALKFCSGLAKILPPSVTNLLQNADKQQINLVRTHL
jgi:hypothetical protein